MPAAPGESLLSTVYADIHYLFRIAPPSQPQQQRFARGSYVYLYHSPADRRTKLEVANHAGTPDQDAFYGYLDSAQRITYSSKQPTLCTIVLEQARINTQSEWHLTTFDERNEKRWAHKLHTVNLYFWTEKDAAAFARHLKSVIPADKLDFGAMAAETPAEHRNSMSPVVQQLERTAIGSHYPPRAGSATSAQSFPGPPTPASTATASTTSYQAQQSTPLAYNPAAPAAPEPIAHREKTPPPPDGETGTGLTNAARHDSQQPFHQYATYGQQHGTSSLQSTPQSSYFPGPPQSGAPPPVTQQQQPSAPSTQYASYSSSNSYGSSITSPPIHEQKQPPTPSAPPAYGMHTPLQSPGLPPAPALNPAVHAAQIAGMSSYSYNPTQQTSQYSQQLPSTGNIHTQFYQPMQGEAANGHFQQAQPQQSSYQQQSYQHGHQQYGQQQQSQQQTYQPSQQAQQQQTAQQGQQQQGFADKYKVGERLNSVEKGIGGFLKKLDKKF